MKRILVVDDEVNIALILREGLQSLGACEVLVATDESTACEHIAVGLIDLLVTDYRMPGQDGLKLIAYTQKQYPQVKTVIMTAYSDDDLLIQAEKLGVDAVLTKPMRLDPFRTLVQRLLFQ